MKATTGRTSSMCRTHGREPLARGLARSDSPLAARSGEDVLRSLGPSVGPMNCAQGPDLLFSVVRGPNQWAALTPAKPDLHPITLQILELIRV